MALYGQVVEREWVTKRLPLIIAIAVVMSLTFGTLFELKRLIGGRVLAKFILDVS